MTTNYLFSGADVSGRDEVLGPKARTTRASREAKPPSKPANILARTSAVFAIAAGVCFASSVPAVSVQSAEAADVPIDMQSLDPTAARIFDARTDGIPPTTEARAAACTLLVGLRSVGLEPSRVLADPDGGVSLYVFAPGDESQPRRYARLLATNEEEVIATFENPQGTRSVWPVKADSLDRAMDRVSSFVRGKA